MPIINVIDEDMLQRFMATDQGSGRAVDPICQSTFRRAGLRSQGRRLSEQQLTMSENGRTSNLNAPPFLCSQSWNGLFNQSHELDMTSSCNHRYWRFSIFGSTAGSISQASAIASPPTTITCASGGDPKGASSSSHCYASVGYGMGRTIRVLRCGMYDLQFG